MRLASVLAEGGRRIGVVHGDTVAVLPAELGGLDEAIRGGADALDAVRAAARQVEAVPLAEVRLDAPLRRFNRDILCTGWNYWDHFEESRGKREGQDPAEPPSTRPSSPRARTRSSARTTTSPTTRGSPPSGTTRRRWRWSSARTAVR